MAVVSAHGLALAKKQGFAKKDDIHAPALGDWRELLPTLRLNQMHGRFLPMNEFYFVSSMLLNMPCI
jgi:hypothetical protein